jgi:threonine aldolase
MHKNRIRAQSIRKIFGGGMRQAGILAAGALFALDHNIDRLKEDHANAKLLAKELSNLPGIHLDLQFCTNKYYHLRNEKQIGEC